MFKNNTFVILNVIPGIVWKKKCPCKGKEIFLYYFFQNFPHRLWLKEQSQHRLLHFCITPSHVMIIFVSHDKKYNAYYNANKCMLKCWICPIHGLNYSIIFKEKRNFIEYFIIWNGHIRWRVSASLVCTHNVVDSVTHRVFLTEL